MSPQSTLGWPNRISIARILLVVPFVVCLMNLDAPWAINPRHAAIAIFVLMAVSDGLDGFLARRLRQETPLGRFLDPLGDKLLITASVILLAVVGVPSSGGQISGGVDRLPLWVVLAVIGKDLLIVVGFVTASCMAGRLVIEPRRLGKLCTVAQLALVLAFLVKPALPTVLNRVPDALTWVVAILVVAASVDYVRLGLRIVAVPTHRNKEPI